MNNPKPSYKTGEFYLTIIINAAIAYGFFTAGEGAETLQAVLIAAGAIVTAAFNISRGIAKMR